MREIRKSGSTRGEVKPALRNPPLLYRLKRETFRGNGAHPRSVANGSPKKS